MKKSDEPIRSLTLAALNGGESRYREERMLRGEESMLTTARWRSRLCTPERAATHRAALPLSLRQSCCSHRA